MYNEKHNAFVEEIKNIEININILKDKIKKTRNKKILKQLGKELEFENNCNMITKEKFNKFMDFYKEINENYKKANQYALENFGSTDLKYINRYIDENNFVKYGVNIIKVHGDQFYINKFKNTIYNKMIENFLTKYDLLEEIFKLEKKSDIGRVSVEEALNIVDKFGVLYVLDDPEAYGWDGNQFYFGGNEGEAILHELCHWLVADPERRNIPEFGLGPGFTTKDENGAKNSKCDGVDEETEEYATCFLTWALILKNGFSPLKDMLDTNFLYETIDVKNDDKNINMNIEDSLEKYNDAIKILIDKKLMSYDFNFITESTYDCIEIPSL